MTLIIYWNGLKLIEYIFVGLVFIFLLIRSATINKDK